MDRLKIHPEQGRGERIQELVLLQRPGVELRLRVSFVEQIRWAGVGGRCSLRVTRIKDKKLLSIVF